MRPEPFVFLRKGSTSLKINKPARANVVYSYVLLAVLAEIVEFIYNRMGEKKGEISYFLD